MQLLALALYHRDGRPEPRVIRFRPGALNILTGESETGKSEVLDIVDYCLGRTKPNLPDEPIDQTVGWYALLVSFGDSRMLMVRPRPTGASTIHAMVRIGDNNLDIPRGDQLNLDSDVTVTAAVVLVMAGPGERVAAGGRLVRWLDGVGARPSSAERVVCRGPVV